MKTLILGLLFGLLCKFSFAQNLPAFETIKLDVKEDYDSSANSAALKASNYLLSTPFDNKNIDRLKSTQYLIKWMTGTPDYHFVLDEQAVKFAKKDDDLLVLYMAAMTKYVLENKKESTDQNKIKLNATRSIITYAKDSKNNLKINSELKKMIEADEQGKLESYLKI
ncbi:hypothetical protein QTN47_21320 [Danxiaibacter flavus]|uniref:Uncharacterized protein n=1 Tax=Danxiaibacter flavus TaxID=3049108 RepID=A0ABV3ZNC0_9BACT|nr:hypothetical protein QNM32_21325 [Chitinophagaceae bacterium DXS]